MAGIKIKKQFGRQYRWFLLGSLPVFALLALMLLAYWIDDDSRLPIVSFVFAVLMLALVSGFGFAFWQLWRLDRHPDLVRLTRYGPLVDLLPGVEAELADPERVTRLGRPMQSFRLAGTGDDDFASAEIWLTPSWLVYVTQQGNRMQFFRFDRIVQAGRIGNAVLLVDDSGERLEIPGTEAGAARLLAETMMRVPGVLDSFEAEREKTSTETRQQVVVQICQRREQIHRSPPGSAVEPERGE